LLKQLGLENSKIKNVDLTDGLRITLVTDTVIHLRPSENALELRCYAEAERYSSAHSCVDKVIKNSKNPSILLSIIK